MYIRQFKDIVIRYRDREVWLKSVDGQRFGTMTETEDRIEFDFSQCVPMDFGDSGSEPVSEIGQGPRLLNK